MSSSSWGRIAIRHQLIKSRFKKKKLWEGYAVQERDLSFYLIQSLGHVCKRCLGFLTQNLCADNDFHLNVYVSPSLLRSLKQILPGNCFSQLLTFRSILRYTSDISSLWKSASILTFVGMLPARPLCLEQFFIWVWKLMYNLQKGVKLTGSAP